MNIFKNRNNVITYTVNKNNYNNLYISVQNGEVIINAPWYMAANQIQKIVEEKKQWILNKINEYEEASKEKKEYTKLDTVKVLGSNYELSVKYKLVEKLNLSVEEDKILVTLPYKYKKVENAELIKNILDKMYDMVAAKEVERIMEKTRLTMNIAPEDYEIRKMENRLGMCIDSKITINPEIAMYSKDVIEYIIVHEFCHLKYKNHTKSFYNMLKTYMPNYEEYAKELNSIKY